LALAASVAIAFRAEFASRTSQSAKRIEQHLDLPVLLSVPKVEDLGREESLVSVRNSG